MYGRIILKIFWVNVLTRNIIILGLCVLLSGCSMFYGMMCSASILLTPNEYEEKIFTPNAVIEQLYDQQVDMGNFVGLSEYHIVENPSWLTVTLMTKNQDGELIPLITENNWKTHVINQENPPRIIAHLQGIAPKSGHTRVKIKATSGRSMCGTTDPIFVLQLKIVKAD
ncbi:hypothetical protein AB7X06_04530 [Providencia rettgeri]